MDSLSKDVYYVVGFEGRSGDAVVTYGAAALARNGRLINAVLSSRDDIGEPLSKLDEYVRDGGIEPVPPHPIPDYMGVMPGYVVRVKTSSIVGAIIFTKADKRYTDSWTDPNGWTYYLYQSFGYMDCFIKPVAETLLDWSCLPGINPEDRKTVKTAARILDHRIATAEMIIAIGEDSERMESLMKSFPEHNQVPGYLLSKIRNSKE